MNKFGEFYSKKYDNSVIILQNFKELDIPESNIKLAIFDLDHTLIKPKSFRIFPINDQDWRWVFQEVPLKLKKLAQKKFLIFVVSNQLGISLNRVSKDMLCKRINNSFSNIDIKICFLLATKDDYYRKPSIGCFELIKCQFQIKSTQIDYKKSFFCGDSYGKNSKKSSADLLFALNTKLIFKTPENCFLNHENLDLKTLNLFDPTKQSYSTNQNNLKKKVQKYLDVNKICFIVTGPPFSGKTYLIKKIFNVTSKDIFYLRTNKEIECLKKNFEEKLSNKKMIYIEMVQNKKQKRQLILDYIKNQKFQICGIHLKRNINFCLHLLNFEYFKKKIFQKKITVYVSQQFIYIILFYELINS